MTLIPIEQHDVCLRAKIPEKAEMKHVESRANLLLLHTPTIPSTAGLSDFLVEVSTNIPRNNKPFILQYTQLRV